MTRLGLRDRLTVGTLAVLLLALVSGGVASYASLRWFLLERVDANLDALAERSTVVPLLVSGAPVPVESYTEDLPAHVYLALYDEQGQTVLVNAPEDLRGPGRLVVPGPGQLSNNATDVDFLPDRRRPQRPDRVPTSGRKPDHRDHRRASSPVRRRRRHPRPQPRPDDPRRHR